MVNTGRRSGRCASCKTRKIKCDELRPSCSQCSKAGWTCPGYKDVAEINFRNETELVIERVRRDRSPQPSQLTLQSSRNTPRSLSPALSDSGIGFFIHQYVSSGTNDFGASTRGNHEYLPKLLGKVDACGSRNAAAARAALETITAAAGLAGLANSQGSQSLIPEAYKLYGDAIRQVRHALQDPLQVCADETLAAVMLMGTFETIASADKESMKSFSYHTIAAARLIEQRGPQQFETEEAIRLYHQLRRLIVMTSLQMQETVPYALERWSRWASPAQKLDELNANRFSEINGRLGALRAHIKHQKIKDPSTVAAMLLPVDRDLESWKNNVPAEWNPKLYRLLQDGNKQPAADDLNSQHEVYPDLWVASMWNNYRVVRILIHESIMSTTLKYGTTEEKEALQSSVRILREMTTQVCRSVAFHLGAHEPRKALDSSLRRHGRCETAAIPGGYLLVWPLFLAGMLRTTPGEQKQWMASRMHHIATTMGLRLAYSLAEALRVHDKSFSDPEAWVIGEFQPQ